MTDSFLPMLSSDLKVKYIYNIFELESWQSFERVSSNHRIVSAKIYLSTFRNKIQTVKALQYDWSSLTNSDISNQYIVTVRNKFNTLKETSERLTPND